MHNPVYNGSATIEREDSDGVVETEGQVEYDFIADNTVSHIFKSDNHVDYKGFLRRTLTCFKNI